MSRQLKVNKVSVRYGDFVAVREASLELQAGDIGCLLGPSGCGKTSLLRAIAGFEPITTGSISLSDREISTPQLLVPTEQRRVGMVFQDFALFPHLDVAGNIGFGLAQLSRNDRLQKVEAMLDLIGLSDLAHSFPHQLSGGQQQRVALARALAPNPELLLLDEPFSSLDSELRESLAAEVRALLKASGVTAILVTHDQHEAFAMADHITLLKDGAVIQAGTPRELYQSPEQPFVADFIGQGSVITVVASDNGILNHDLGVIDPAAIPAGHSGKLRLLLRANQVVIDSNSNVHLPVTGRAFRGAHFLYTLALPDGQQLHCLATIDVEVEIGDSLPVRLELTRPTLFAAN